MKKFALLLATLLVASCAHMPAPVSSRRLSTYFESTVIVKAQKSVVNDDGSMKTIGWSGTGFSIATSDEGSQILTNKHVCEMKDEAAYIITDYTGKKYSAKFVRYAHNADLCLLTTEAIVHKVKLADNDAPRFSHIVVVGAPHGVFPNATDGFISGYIFLDLEGDTYEIHVRAQQTSVPIYPGNSGSPVFNDAGENVGIMFAGNSRSEHMTYLVPVREIHDFLDQSGDIYER